MKCVRHFYANRANMGDWASALGVQQSIRDASPDEVEFHEHFLSSPVSDRDIDEINEEANLVVVGGGGLLFRKNFPLGWYWNITPDRLARLRPPIVLYSIGLNSEHVRAQEWKLRPESIEGIGRVMGAAALVGLRDGWSLRWASETFGRDFEFAPCPSLFLRSLAGKGEHGSTSTVGVNLVPRNKLRNGARFLDAMKGLLLHLADQGLLIRFLCHAQEPEDMVAELAQVVPSEVFCPKDPLALLAEYGDVGTILCVRAHAALLAFNQNTPFCNIEYNTKCQAFLTMLNSDERMIRWPGRFWTTAGTFGRRVDSQLERLRAESDRIRTEWEPLRADLRERNECFAAAAVRLME